MGKQIVVVDKELTTARKVVKGNQQLMLRVGKLLELFELGYGYLDQPESKSTRRVGQEPSYFHPYNTILLTRGFQNNE